MKLPIPIFCKDTIYREVELKKPNAGVIADTQKAAEDSDVYSALLTFVGGCVKGIRNGTAEAVEDKSRLKMILPYLSYKATEYLSIKILLMIDDNDGIEGIYKCPRCDNNIICEEKDDIDTRDMVNDQKVIEMEEDESNIIQIKLEEPIELKNELDNDVIEVIETIEMELPKIKDCIAATKKIGNINKSELQLEIYNQATIKINGNEIDNKYKNRYGKSIFRKLSFADSKEISRRINKFGLSQTKEKICNKCGKKFTITLNTANFFGSALQSIEE
jgi:hypothetical protein